MISVWTNNPAFGQDFDENPDIVWEISFRGNTTYSNILLGDIIATTSPGFFKKVIGKTEPHQLNENDARRDVVRIQRYYERRGFNQAEVTYSIETLWDSWKKHVIFQISEGNPVMIGRVDIQFDSSPETESLIRESRDFQRILTRHDFQPGFRYQLIRAADVEGLFVQSMEEEGFAYARVEIDTATDSLSGEVSLTIRCIPGPRTYFENFNIEGETTVDERIILQEMTLARGEVYSRSKMQLAQRQLFNHHLFRFATVNFSDQPQDSTLDLTIRIREYPLRSVEASFGIGREDLLRGQLSWLHRNVFHVGNRFTATGRASFIEQRAGVDFLVPYVFNTRSSFVSSPYVQHRIEPAFELFRAGFSNSLIYQHTQNFTSALSYELTVNEELSGQSSTQLPDSVLSYNTASLTLSSYYTQGLTRAEEGWVVRPTLELSSLFGEGTYQYQKGTVDIRRFTHLTSSLVLANRIQTGFLNNAAQDSLPANIRYFSGGTNSVRGWSRQNLGPKRIVFDDEGEFDGYVPIGGQAMFLFNFELRQELDFLIEGLGIAAFFDGGQVWRNVSDYNPLRIDKLEGRTAGTFTRSLQFGVGGGLSYESPIGPIRFDLGYKLNPTDADLNHYEGRSHGGFGRWAIHFSIGQAF